MGAGWVLQTSESSSKRGLGSRGGKQSEEAGEKSEASRHFVRKKMKKIKETNKFLPPGPQSKKG